MTKDERKKLREKLVEPILQVLSAAEHKVSTARKAEPQFLTAYQIVDRLPEQLRSELIGNHTAGGAGSDREDTAAKLVAETIRVEPHATRAIHRSHIDAEGLRAVVAGKTLTPTPAFIGIYRLRLSDEMDRDDGEASEV